MKVIESCAECLLDKQKHLTEDPEYLAEVEEIIRNRRAEDSAPYLVYLFGRAWERRFGPRKNYTEIKQKYNNFVLDREKEIRQSIERSEDPVRTALGYARVGNYIDFGAMNVVEENVLIRLLEEAALTDRDQETMESFLRQCGRAERFLLIADNCGEIVLDKLLIEQLQKRFPQLHISVMVRGGEVLNDATGEDARQTGLDQICRVIPNGSSVAGTVYGMLSEEARAELDSAEVILAKGQGNYETLSGQGRHIFYAFLCKCDLFTSRFGVPRLTGILVEESA